jgi:hypothetical protein
MSESESVTGSRLGSGSGATGVTGGIDRRRFLAVTAAAGLAGTAVMLDPVSFAANASPGPGTSTQTKTITGKLAAGAPDWVYLPVDVPHGVAEIQVDYSYDKPAAPAGQAGNALDIGIFDEGGVGLGDGAGFRGWSGGARTSFTISRSAATPGYRPGRVNAGRWHVILGPYTVVPAGLNYTVTVTLRFGPPGPAFVPRAAPHRAQGRGAAWYRGDMHLHTVHSDGLRTPAELAAGARAAHLDFIVSTEHNTPSASDVWGDFAGPDLLIVDGEEITTRNGHYLALGLPADTWIDWRYRATDGSFLEFARQIHRLGGLVVAAHPYCPFVGCSWKFGPGGLDAVEVWNGPWTIDDEVSVSDWDSTLAEGARTGRWLPAVGDSDAHREPQVIGLPQTVVWASDLTRDAVLAGVRAGRSWLAESAAVDVSFTCSAGNASAGIGQRLRVADDALVTATVTVSGAPGTAVRLITDEGQMALTALPASGSGTVTYQTTPRIAPYIRAEVRRPDPATPLGAMVAMTNPIFLGRQP